MYSAFWLLYGQIERFLLSAIPGNSTRLHWSFLLCMLGKDQEGEKIALAPTLSLRLWNITLNRDPWGIIYRFDERPPRFLCVEDLHSSADPVPVFFLRERMTSYITKLISGAVLLSKSALVLRSGGATCAHSVLTTPATASFLLTKKCGFPSSKGEEKNTAARTDGVVPKKKLFSRFKGNWVSPSYTVPFSSTSV